MIKKETILIAFAREKTCRSDISDVSRCKNSILNVLSKKNIRTGTLFIEKKDFNDIPKLKRKILNKKPYCIFNLFEGFSDEAYREAEFAGVLEKINIPFTGNPSFTLGTCLDKARAKRILKNSDIPVPEGIIVNRIEKSKLAGLKFPVFIKPRSEDASVGIDKNSLIFSKEKLINILPDRLNEFPGGLLVESFLPGDEYSVAFVGNGPYEMLGISVIKYSLYKELLPFLTYASKWNKEAEEFKKIQPSRNAKINKDLKRRIVSKAEKAANALGCKGYFRVDLRAKKGKVFVIDINPNPDINKDSGYIKQARLSGYSYTEILEKIVQLAIKSNGYCWH